MVSGTGIGVTGKRGVVAALVALVVIYGACADTTGTGEADLTLGDEPAIEYMGSLSLEPAIGLPGTVVTVSGDGFTPDVTFDLTWGSADGSWLLEGEANEAYMGRQFVPTVATIGQVVSAADGSVAGEFVVPDDYGFAHDVRLVDPQGVIRNQALFVIEMEVSVSPESGPVGTPITIEVRGMGTESLEGNRQILYDNQYTGWLSAVTTKGVATVVIPATGSVGPHQIRVMRGAFTFPYLNPQQSPRPDIPVFDAVFSITEGEPVLPAPIDEQVPAPVARGSSASPSSGPWITTDLISAETGTPIVMSGGGFEAGDELSFTWYRIIGNRVAGQGWEERGIEFGSAAVGPDGMFELKTEVPGDVGGSHRIEAFLGDEVAASTEFVVTPAALPMKSTAVSWGESIDIELTGVGWTETANIYTIVYDNVYIGYACGFNSQGDVYVSLQATGDPGWHFVDLYPAIYKGTDPGVQSFRIPMLTYAEHPGESLPAFHYAFYIEE